MYRADRQKSTQRCLWFLEQGALGILYLAAEVWEVRCHPPQGLHNRCVGVTCVAPVLEDEGMDVGSEEVGFAGVAVQNNALGSSLWL